jgi:succinyl-CoA synthetase beta subunit
MPYSSFDNINITQDYGVTVQKFRMATNEAEAARIPEEFPCSEYVIKAQVLAGGRGKGHFDNGFKGGVHLTKDPAKVSFFWIPAVLRIRIRFGSVCFGPPGSGFFYHQEKVVRKTMIPSPTVL